MKQIYHNIGVIVLCLTMIPVVVGCTSMKTGSSSDIPRLSIETLLARINDPSILVLDDRLPGDQKRSKMKIKGAVRENPNDYLSWADKYHKSKNIVFY
jgi:hypothetical protein